MLMEHRYIIVHGHFVRGFNMLASDNYGIHNVEVCYVEKCYASVMNHSELCMVCYYPANFYKRRDYYFMFKSMK